MATLMATVFVASLVGSMHCVGMCGALVIFAVGTPEESPTARTPLHLLYHGGRGIGYVLIGAACGLAGSMLDLGGALVGLQRSAGLLAGGLMIAVGFMTLMRYTHWRLPHLSAPGFWQRWIVQAQRMAATLRPQPRAATIGLLTGLLPCGWLYLFAVTAAGTGHWYTGALVMLSFWAGTVPGLLMVGLGAQAFTRWMGARAPLLSSLAIIAIGIFTLTGRMQLSLDDFQQNIAVNSISTSAQTVEHVQTLTADKAPCCAHGR